MINLFISLFIAVCSIQFFTISLKTSYLNKTIYNYPKALLEYSLIIDDENHIEPYIDADFFISQSETYFLYTLNSNYFNYTVSYYFYDPIDEGICIDDYCEGVKIEFISPIYSFYTYRKTITFEVIHNE